MGPLWLFGHSHKIITRSLCKLLFNPSSPTQPGTHIPAGLSLPIWARWTAGLIQRGSSYDTFSFVR